MTPGLFTLDERHPLSPAGRLWLVVGLTAYLCVSALMIAIGNAQLAMAPGAQITQAMVVGTVAGITALLLFGQARATQNPGYVWLAAGYQLFALMQLTTVLFWPGAFELGRLLGNEQSGPFVNLVWLWLFPAAMVVSALAFRRHQVRAMEPRLRYPVGPVAVAVGLLALGTIAIAGLASDRLPQFVKPGGDYTTLTVGLVVLWVGAMIIATILMVVFATQLQTAIHRWMAAIMIIILGQALVNSFSERWSLSWFYDKWMGIVAASLLLAALLLLLNRAFRSMRVISSQDALTGAESRLSLTQATNPFMDRGQRCTLLWIDVDNFKSINDEMGHAVGDQALVVLANRIRKAVGTQGRVGRLGGDEFGVLVANEQGDPATAPERDRVNNLADEIGEQGRRPIEIDGTTSLLSFSIGIVSAPLQATTTQELLQNADLAMYAAKGAGGDRYQWFDNEISETIVEDARLRNKLSRSIQETKFDLDYQPIVAGVTHEVVGVEALVRWIHEEERIPAGRFIDFAERTGQIVDIGRLIITTLETDVAQILQALPPNGFVSFNLSVQELLDDRTVQRLVTGPLCERSEDLIIEVTENLELHGRPKARANLERLRTANYTIAIDDFGSGFSNFTRLEDLRPQVLKIDRSLVVRAGLAGHQSDAFLRAAVEVARSLNCRMIAEGVETAEEQSAVDRQAIDLLQGYRFGRPVPLGVLLRTLSGGVPDQRSQPEAPKKAHDLRSY